jgi:uncharacterized protein (DUF2062 family)
LEAREKMGWIVADCIAVEPVVAVVVAGNIVVEMKDTPVVDAVAAVVIVDCTWVMGKS